MTLANAGRGASLEMYSLVATSPKEPETTTPGDNVSDVDFKTVAVETYGVPAGFCSDNDSFVYAFDVSTWERQTHAVAPALFEFDLDLDKDGVADYAVYNRDLAGLATLADGRNVVFVQNLATGVETGLFTTDHNTNSANTVLYACAEQLGLSLADVGSSFDAAGFAVDFYTSGTVRDEVEFTGVFGGERYVGIAGGSPYFGAIGTGASIPFQIFDFGPSGASPDETGIVIRVVNGDAATENLSVTVAP